MPDRRFSRLAKVARATLRQPAHFFRQAEQEASNLAWIERASTLPSLPEVELPDLIPSLTYVLEAITFRAGGSSLPDYLLLQGLCRQYSPCNYFEIGTFLGESLATVAPYCAQCVSLSLDEEEFAASPELAAEARRVSRMFSNPLPNVKHFIGDSTRYDFTQISERFDVIFVDGCHDYLSVVSDTQNAVKLMRNSDSIIVFHDAKNAYNELEPEVIAGIYDGLPAEWKGRLYTVSNTLCAVATRKPMTPVDRVSLKANPYVKPQLKFALTARIDRID